MTGSAAGAREKPEVAFFVFYASIYYCGPWINSARLWAERGYRVRVYQFADPALGGRRLFEGEDILVHELPGYWAVRALRFALDRAFGVFRRFGLEALSLAGFELAYLVSSLSFMLLCLLAAGRHRAAVFIGGDPPGLLAADLLARRKGGELIYWSLELWMEEDLEHRFVQKLWKRIERDASRRALCIIEFGEDRCELLRRENGLPGEAMISVPNAPLGEARDERGDYFRERFSIPGDCRIILYAGGLGGSFYGVEELLERLDGWPRNAVLVLHSRDASPRVRRRIEALASRSPVRVYLDLEPVGYDSLPLIYSSCDIGLQVWQPVNTNLRHPGLSSGKVFHHLQAGVPVIVRRLEGYPDFIEGNGVGLCVGHMGEVGRAITRILADYGRFRENCLKAFARYSFRAAHDRIVLRVENALPGGAGR